jgi:pimeloyl-ACP methyl ester carboxylesterase
MIVRKLKTKRGVNIRIFEGGSGAPLVFLHGAGGFLAENPFLDQLAQHYYVVAPELPAFGESTGEELLEDMLDFALHGWDVVSELGLTKPHLMGHSMGGMIAAEMACIAPNDLAKLVLVAPVGLWIPEHPIPDIFSFLPHDFVQYLFHDRAKGEALLTGGFDMKNPEALAEFYIANSKRLSMAGKILFPVPNRRLSKRLYRLSAMTLLIWGKSDKLIPPVYADYWKKSIPQAQVMMLDNAGHMPPYEQPEAFVAAVTKFLD